MQTSDLLRIVRDLEKQAQRAIVDNKKYEFRWRAMGRAKAYQNVIEYLELMQHEANR
jgi:hypothetical protein